MKKIHSLFLFVIFLITGCAKQPQAVLPTALPATMTTAPTATVIPPTDTPLPPPTETLMPAPTQDPAVFGAIGTSEIQAFALESVVNAIFKQKLDGVLADGRIQEYQVISVTVFPGSGGLLAEVIYNVRTTDPAWLADGGTQSADGWINGSCSRFDFVTTETEYQLKNKRLCG